jgi:glycosylphosphatidylinositol transamidase (GPIT) subunit GPI8
MKFLLMIGFVFLCILSDVMQAPAQGNLVITLRNFFDVRNSQEGFYYSPVKEQGIPASKHILIIKSGHCRDDAKDNAGNTYYFYMFDRSKGLKALVTEKTLDPAEGLDETIQEFVELVKAEIKKDGGIISIIGKFRKMSQFPRSN